MSGFFRIWSGKGDSNSRPQPWQGYALPTELFPRSLFGFLNKKLNQKKFWSGKGDSNSRPQPWQGYALPTELFPRSLFGFLNKKLNQKILERETRLELATPTLARLCSTN